MQSLRDTQPSQVRTCRLTKPHMETHVSVGGAGKVDLDSEGSRSCSETAGRRCGVRGSRPGSAQRLLVTLAGSFQHPVSPSLPVYEQLMETDKCRSF